MPDITSTAVTLSTALGRHAIGDLMRSGDLSDPRVTFEFADVEPIHRAFAPMVRDQKYDLSELAIVTALQAVAYGHPVVVLPVVPASRFQRKCLISHASRPITDPTQLRGRRLGVRAYTQTTGFWVRSHLAEDFGVAADESQWFTQEEAHVPEFHDPAFVDPTWPGSLVDALRSGELDAVILGNDLPTGDEFVQVFDRPAERDRAWYDLHGYAPINHVVVVATETLEREPEAVRAAYELLARAEESAAEAGSATSVDAPRLTMSGFDRLEPAIAEIAAACYAQGLLPRPLTSDDVLGPARRLIQGATTTAS